MTILKQSTIRNRVFFLTGTGLTPTLTISKNGAAFGAAAGVVSELSSGWYAVALTAADTNTLGDLAYHFSAGTVKDFQDEVVLDLPGANIVDVTGDMDGDVKGIVRGQIGVPGMSFISGNGITNQTANAGTRIRVPLGSEFPNLFVHVSAINYTAQGTGHTLTLMKGASRSFVDGAVVAGASSITVDDVLTDGAGNVIAANDVIAVKLDNGTWLVTTVSSLSGGNLIIATADVVPVGRSIPDNARIVAYGVAGDAFHASHQYTAASSTTTNLGNAASLVKASSNGEPVIFDSNNASAAGTLNYANWGYTQN